MNNQRLDELAAAWSTDDPDPALRAELEDVLRRDPAARRRFLDHCVAEMALVESLASAAKAKEVKEHPGSLRLSPLVPTRHNQIRTWALWAAGIAALLVVALLLFPTSEALHVTAGNLVADGRTFSSGSRVALPLSNAVAGSEGVELDTQVGVVMRADPSTTFTITAPGNLRLDSGQLTLEVDGKRAPPTAVHTSELVVQVVGTRFSVARRAAQTAVAVQQGQVRVVTPNHVVQELSAGKQIVADATGFITSDRQQSALVRLSYLAEDRTERVLELLDQTIRVPADRPFTLRAEVDRAVAALGYRLSSSQNLPMHPRRIEVSRPFDLWGDTDHQPIFSTLPVGTHRMTMTFFADKLGEQPLETRQFVVIAE